MRSIVVLACAGMATLAFETATPVVAQIPDAPLRMTAFAVNMSSVGRGGANTVDIKKKNTLELENYSSEPVRLTTVKAEPVKK